MPRFWWLCATDVVWPTHDSWDSWLQGNNTPLQPTLRQLPIRSLRTSQYYIQKKEFHGTPCPASLRRLAPRDIRDSFVGFQVRCKKKKNGNSRCYCRPGSLALKAATLGSRAAPLVLRARTPPHGDPFAAQAMGSACVPGGGLPASCDLRRGEGALVRGACILVKRWKNLDIWPWGASHPGSRLLSPLGPAAPFLAGFLAGWLALWLAAWLAALARSGEA